MWRFLRHIKEIFPLDIFLKALPIITIFIGLVLFGASYWIFAKDAHPDAHEAMKSLGQAVLVSGVVSAILASFTYIGIFKNAVFDVMYGSEYLSTRPDLPEIWARVTTAICRNKFSSFTGQLYPRILEKHLPSEKSFIYSKFDRECIIDWHDKSTGVAQLTETINLVLTSNTPEDVIAYTYSSRTDSRTPRHLAKIDIRDLEVDGAKQETSKILIEEEFDDDFGGKGWRSHYSFELTGKSEYTVRRVLNRKICLLQDPVLEFISPQFIAAASIRVHSMTSDLRPVFVSIGSDEFQNGGGDPKFWAIHKELKGTLIPRQGYIVFVQSV